LGLTHLADLLRLAPLARRVRPVPWERRYRLQPERAGNRYRLFYYRTRQAP